MNSMLNWQRHHVTDWLTCDRKNDCIYSVPLSEHKVGSWCVLKMICLLHSDLHCCYINFGKKWFQTFFIGACGLKNIVSTHPPPLKHTNIHMRYFLFTRWSNFSLQNTAVTWLKYCRYGVNLYPINQSIYQSSMYAYLIEQLTPWN